MVEGPFLSRPDDETVRSDYGFLDATVMSSFLEAGASEIYPDAHPEEWQAVVKQVARLWIELSQQEEYVALKLLEDSFGHVSITYYSVMRTMETTLSTSFLQHPDREEFMLFQARLLQESFDEAVSQIEKKKQKQG